MNRELLAAHRVSMLDRRAPNSVTRAGGLLVMLFVLSSMATCVHVIHVVHSPVPMMAANFKTPPISRCERSDAGCVPTWITEYCNRLARDLTQAIEPGLFFLPEGGHYDQGYTLCALYSG